MSTLTERRHVGPAFFAQQTPEYTLVPYVIQSILLLVAPALFAATIYMELGRIMLLFDKDIRPRGCLVVLDARFSYEPLCQSGSASFQC